MDLVVGTRYCVDLPGHGTCEVSSRNGPRVFLGVPATLTPRQQMDLDQWLVWLADHSMFVTRLERAQYSDDPWETLNRIVASTDGVVLLGFRQLDARGSVERPGTDEESVAVGWRTSPWLQIEAGMSTALGLPVLVAPEAGVAEGVFSTNAWRGRVEGTGLRPAGVTGMRWLEAVHKRWVARIKPSCRDRGLPASRLQCPRGPRIDGSVGTWTPACHL